MDRNRGAREEPLPVRIPTPEPESNAPGGPPNRGATDKATGRTHGASTGAGCLRREVPSRVPVTRTHAARVPHRGSLTPTMAIAAEAARIGGEVIRGRRAAAPGHG